jgi:hypothetical protein
MDYYRKSLPAMPAHTLLASDGDESFYLELKQREVIKS